MKATIYKIDGGDTFEGTLEMFRDCFYSNATHEMIMEEGGPPELKGSKVECYPKFPLTDAQQRVLATARSAAVARIEVLKVLILEAEAAVVRLPHVNEHGDSVIHACNKQMYNIIDYYKHELHALKNMWWI